MARTSREPKLAYRHMNQIPKSWRSSFGAVLIRIILLAFWVGVALLAVRLMSWADEGSRYLPVTTPAGVHGSF